MAFYEVREVEPWDCAVLHDPASANHDAVGAMRSAQNKGGQRVAAAGKSQFVEFEQRQVSCFADRDFAHIASAGAGRRAFRRPPQGIVVAHFSDAITAALEKERGSHLLHQVGGIV